MSVAMTVLNVCLNDFHNLGRFTAGPGSTVSISPDFSFSHRAVFRYVYVLNELSHILFSLCQHHQTCMYKCHTTSSFPWIPHALKLLTSWRTNITFTSHVYLSARVGVCDGAFRWNSHSKRVAEWCRKKGMNEMVFSRRNGFGVLCAAACGASHKNRL